MPENEIEYDTVIISSHHNSVKLKKGFSLFSAFLCKSDSIYLTSVCVFPMWWLYNT